ncbi:MAG TPA: tripartite tricarboxylate transporter substrate binding protein [Dehalococcoidia bacterium]|nr:tripartite tricarboxylate transporter substrate binding protein [Dehalococcoidia bacterium]
MAKTAASPAAKTVASPSPQAAAPNFGSWRPSRAIEFNVQAGAGGGSDLLARTVKDTLERENMIDVPITVVNRPGGNGAISYGHTISKRGDPHTWQTSTDSMLIAPLRGEADYDYKNMTPFATIAIDDFFLVTASNSRFNTVQDVVNAAKAQPGTLTVGGVGAGSTDNLLTGMFEQKAGVTFSFVPFNGQGEMLSSLLGGHVQLGWSNPGEALEQVRAGRVKILGVASDQRIAQEPNVPTLKEQGVDMTFVFRRTILGPGGLAPEVVHYYEALFQQMTSTEYWQTNYIEKNFLTPAYLNSAQTAQALDRRNEEFRQLLDSLGFLGR